MTGFLLKAIKFIKNGQTEAAAKILHELIKQDPTSGITWIWMAACEKSDEGKLKCLKKALELNPKLKLAEQEIKALKKSKLINSAGTDSIVPETLKNGPQETIISIKEKVEKETALSISKMELADQDKPAEDKVGQQEQKSNQAEKTQDPQIVEEQPIKINEPPKVFIEDKFWGYQNNYTALDILGARQLTGLYGHRFIIDGAEITLSKPPICVIAGHLLEEEECQLCDYFEGTSCLIRNDNFLFDDLMRFFSASNDWKVILANRRKVRLRAIYKELKTHGSPLHYSVIFRMVASRHPKLKMKLGTIIRYLDSHPGLFVRIGDGVYKAK